MDDTPKEDVKPSTKIEIIVTYQEKSVRFAVKPTSSLRKVLEVFANQLKMDRKSLRFTFDGDAVQPDDNPTPDSLGMVAGDEIQAHMFMEGGSSTSTDRIKTQLKIM